MILWCGRRARSPRPGAVVALAAVVATLLSSCGTGGADGATSSGAGYTTGADGIAAAARGRRTAPATLKGETLEGRTVDVVADHRGEVVVVNVWGSWCPPCREEAPLFEKVAEQTADDGVAFVGIDTRETGRRPGLAFQKTFAITYPSLFDPDGRIVLSGFPRGTLNPQTTPSTVVLDRDGRIAVRYQGPMSAEKLRGMLAPLIAETAHENGAGTGKR